MTKTKNTVVNDNLEVGHSHSNSRQKFMIIGNFLLLA